LSNFMRKNVKRKAKAGIHSPPRQSFSSPPYPISPEEVFDINEKAIESRVTQDSSSARDSSVDTRSPSSSRTLSNSGSPLVQLDYFPEPLENWFPKELLNGTHGAKNSGWSRSVPESEIADATSSDARKEYNQAVTSQVGLDTSL